MNSGQLLHFSLEFHIIGLTIVGGSTLMAFVVKVNSGNNMNKTRATLKS